jgi:hypothetical protein
VPSDLARDLVALETVLEGADLEAELVGHPHQHEHLVRPVGVGVDEDLPVQDVGQGLEAQVPPGRHRLLGLRPRRLQPRLELRPFLPVGPGLQEALSQHRLDAHP